MGSLLELVAEQLDDQEPAPARANA
jgi:hypothetical protein